ncbi:MAG: glycogen/starch synthase [Erysipelotrichaceae bacterium]|nr:glycogen/starch synthase [Erysipelotrichaceae bacterium]
MAAKKATEETAEKKTAEKTTAEKKTAVKKTAEKKTAEKKTAEKKTAVKKKTKTTKTVTDKKTVKKEAVEAAADEIIAAANQQVMTQEPESPRRSIAFIGSECYPFVKTGGLGDVMYALPKALTRRNCDVKVILPRYKCIPQQYQDKMVYRGSFYMDLTSDGKQYYVGIMEYVWDGVVYDFIDNEEFFGGDKPYTNLIDDIPKYCYFSKAALAALNYMNWQPNIIHCHDWQAALVPVYLRTFFQNTSIGNAKTMITIHNLRFQGIYNIKTIKYWTNLPDYVFNKDALTQNWLDANMLKGGLTYSNMITTVSNTYAGEIQTSEYGEGLEAHLRYHSGKLRGIVNGIDYDIWDPSKDSDIVANYSIEDAIAKKRENKIALQKELGLEENGDKFVIGLISRLTNQKGLDLVNTCIPQIMDPHTQVVVLGTGDAEYENSFRYYENHYKGQFAGCIQYDEARSHRIYAGCDVLLVPSRFEPCGLTQLIAMHYGTVPIVRETGGLKDTVEPYNMYADWGNGFTFDRYESGLLYDAINRAKTLYFENRYYWDEMVQRDMAKNVSWDNSAKQYKDLYLELTAW